MIGRARSDSPSSADTLGFRERHAERLRRVGLPENEISRLLDLIAQFGAVRTIPKQGAEPAQLASPGFIDDSHAIVVHTAESGAVEVTHYNSTLAVSESARTDGWKREEPFETPRQFSLKLDVIDI